MILAIDPGNTHSAWVLYNGTRPMDFGYVENDRALIELDRIWTLYRRATLVVEMIASYGMPVGAEVFETCVWIGRFVQAYSGAHAMVYRREVKLHLCGNPRAKDGNVRQAIIDRFGGKPAIGTKKAPGPLYGISGDVWQALAVAITYHDTPSRPM